MEETEHEWKKPCICIKKTEVLKGITIAHMEETEDIKEERMHRWKK